MTSFLTIESDSRLSLCTCGAAAGTIRRCLKAIQNGNSSTVFNYGQSGTGKTYTTVVCSEEILRELLAACAKEVSGFAPCLAV